jgi:DNA-binding NarL/FixJ family response regulator
MQAITGDGAPKSRGNGIPVAVVDPLPSYQAGLAAALSNAGFAPAEPADLHTWVRRKGRRAVVLTLEPLEKSLHFADLPTVNVDVPIVVLLAKPGLQACRRALGLGGCCVLPRQASPRVVVRALEAALEGYSMLPFDIARILATELPHDDGGILNKDEVIWLQRLAEGITVAKLAEENGYAERTMYRRLSWIYRRLHASNRAEALVQAARQGLFD